MARIGVLGGTFNPPHRGHLALARHAMEETGCEGVLLMPARTSPGKQAEEDPGPRHRLQMCRLAVAGVEGVGACALEVEREGPSYTVDTLRALHAAHPDSEVTFILGADVALTLSSWHEAGELPALARFAVALRAGGPAIVELDEVRKALAALSAEPGAPLPDPERLRMDFLNMPPLDVSSSLVRERARRGLPVGELLDPAVAAYIAGHGLYARAGAGVSA